ncbi:hypothetical protein E2C01_019525 [Portunus trituberculatus]|uniref:Uncharacterized protein n=1 Tax=Portunus trituberculatus TaxID=210409 RepID=A0A5B7DZ31_PORTR|nr:hypothetical protein [Portunus trituberculatus]
MRQRYLSAKCANLRRTGKPCWRIRMVCSMPEYLSCSRTQGMSSLSAALSVLGLMQRTNQGLHLESLHTVPHLPCIVLDAKLHGGKTWPDGCSRKVNERAYYTLTKDDTKHSSTHLELNVLPVNLLLGILLLLQLEDVLIEVKLQLLIGIVDAQLLKTVLLLADITNKIFVIHLSAIVASYVYFVHGLYSYIKKGSLNTHLEHFKAKDVQDGDVGLAGTLVDDVVDAPHQPGEQGGVECLGHCVPHIQRLVDVQWREHSLIARLLWNAGQQLIEDVVVPLLVCLGDNAGLLKEVLCDLGTSDHPTEETQERGEGNVRNNKNK